MDEPAAKDRGGRRKREGNLGEQIKILPAVTERKIGFLEMLMLISSCRLYHRV